MSSAANEMETSPSARVSFAVASQEMLLFCRRRSWRGVMLVTPGIKHFPPASVSAAWVASTDTGRPQRLSSAKQWPLSTGIPFDVLC